jgi:gas vesicle protein
MNYESAPMNYDHAPIDGWSTSAFVMFAAGALAGAAAALVLAPASGRETRNYLGKRGRELADNVAAQGRKAWNEHGSRVANAVREGYASATESIADRSPRSAME